MSAQTANTVMNAPGPAVSPVPTAVVSAHVGVVAVTTPTMTKTHPATVLLIGHYLLPYDSLHVA